MCFFPALEVCNLSWALKPERVSVAGALLLPWQGALEPGSGAPVSCDPPGDTCLQEEGVLRFFIVLPSHSWVPTLSLLLGLSALTLNFISFLSLWRLRNKSQYSLYFAPYHFFLSIFCISVSAPFSGGATPPSSFRSRVSPLIRTLSY